MCRNGQSGNGLAKVRNTSERVTRPGRRPVSGHACEYLCVMGPSTLCRAACSLCLRPLSTCLCALVRPTAHSTEVLVLQHPHEQRQAKNSVALLRLSLTHCEVVVGERFAPGTLEALLQRPGAGHAAALS